MMNDLDQMLFKTWMARALNLLARREHSYVELVNKLISKTCPTDIANRVVEHCYNKNYLSLQRFSEVYTHNKSNQGYGPKKIYLELINIHNIPNEIVKVVFETIDWEYAKLIALRKIKPCDPIKQRRALYLRGF